MPPKSYYAVRRGEKLNSASHSSFGVSASGSDVSGGGVKRAPLSSLKSSALPSPSVGSASPLFPNSFSGRFDGSCVGNGDSVVSSAFCETFVPPSVKAELQRLYEFREVLEQRLLEADVNVYFAESEFYRVSCELGSSLFSEGFGVLGSSAPSMSGSGAGGAFSASYAKLDSSLSSSSGNELPRSIFVSDVKEGAEGGIDRRLPDEGGTGSQMCHNSLASVGIPAPLPSACREVRERGEEEADEWQRMKDVNDPSYLYEQSMSAMNSPQNSSFHSMHTKAENNATNSASATRGRRTIHNSNSEMLTKNSVCASNMSRTSGSKQTINPHFLYTSYAYDARLHQFSPAERFFSSSSIGAIGRVEGFLSKIAAAGHSIGDVRNELHIAAGGRQKRSVGRNGKERGGGKRNDSSIRSGIATASSPGVTSVNSLSNAYASSLPFSFSNGTTTLGRWTATGGSGGGGESWAVPGVGSVNTVSASYSTAGNSDVLNSVKSNATSDAFVAGSGDSKNTEGNGGGLGLHYTQGLPTPFSTGKVLSPSTSTVANTVLPATTATSVAVSAAAAAVTTSYNSSGTDVRPKPSNIDERTGKRRYRRRVPLLPKSSSTSTFTGNNIEDDYNDEVASTFRGRRRAARDQSGKEVEEEPRIRETRKYTKRART